MICVYFYVRTLYSKDDKDEVKDNGPLFNVMNINRGEY